MTSERWQQVKQVFQAAEDLPESERAAYLATVAAEVRAEVESLLRYGEQAGGFLGKAAAEYAPEALAEVLPEGAGRRIGAWRIIRELGEGGMGVVYLAERTGEFHQVVALKLIRPGMDSRAVVERFRAERQILARLDHPNIARLVDGGATEDGQPYFVMEYVEGESIDAYARKRGLGERERLELFRQVCSAVEYAHQNLTVHRDIKPGNILVTAAGVPKLLDFGIAKLLRDPESGEAPGVTRPTARLMTPEYASPEQLSGAPITTATDVYSLGVVLRELMAAPLAGDLDTIVRKALEEDLPRRYHSVEQLNADLQRYLEGAPILARPQTFAYLAGRFVRRNRVMVVAAALVLVSLTGGLAVAAWQARIAREQRLRAERRFNEVRQLAHAFLFDFHDSIQNLPGSTPARQLVVNKALEYLNSLSREAAGDAALERELAEAYLRVGDVQGNPTIPNLGDGKGALATYRKALAIAEDVVRRNPADAESQRYLARAHGSIGDMVWGRGDPVAAMPNFREQVRISELLAARAPRDPVVLQGLASAYEGMADALGNPGYPNVGDTRGAREAYRKAQAVLENLSALHPENKRARRGAGLMQMKQGDVDFGSGDVDAALHEYQAAATVLAGASAADPLNAVTSLMSALATGSVGTALEASGQARAALEQYEKASEMQRRLAEADPRNVQFKHSYALSQVTRANLLRKTGDREGALRLYREALGFFEPNLAADPSSPPRQQRVAEVRAAMGRIAADQGHRDEAARLYRQAMPAFKSLAERKGATLDDLANYAGQLIECPLPEFANPAAAIPFLRQVVERTHESRAAYLEQLARAYRGAGDGANAAAFEAKAVALYPAGSVKRKEAEARLAEFRR